MSKSSYIDTSFQFTLCTNMALHYNCIVTFLYTAMDACVKVFLQTNRFCVNMIMRNQQLHQPYLLLKVGKQDVFHMIKAATGDYKKFIRRSDEDVVVLAHTHRWDLRKYRNYKGNQVVYANTGCWTCNAEEVRHGYHSISRKCYLVL